MFQEEVMEKIVTWAGITVLAVVLVAAISALLALPVYLLWNAVIPSVFGLTTITFMQAIQLSLLSSCLFKSSCSNSGRKD